MATAHPPSTLQLDLSRQIIDWVKSGRFAAGSHVSESGLCDAFEVSRSPVRGAMKLVAEHGFLEYRANAGYFVPLHLPTSSSVLQPQWERVSVDDLYRSLLRDRVADVLPKTFTESMLLKRYHAQRSVLTKTLVRLAQEGLIEKRQGHGWQFLMTFDSVDTIAESYRFRILTECAGLLEETFKADSSRLAEMKKAHQALIEKSHGEVSAAEFYALNSAFHEMLAQFSGNRFILQATQQQNLLRRLDEHAAFHGLGPQALLSCREHIDIIEALEQDDREWAASVLRRHLSRAAESKLKRLRK
ncbi:GntR family transcriptional regulator [Burkholderia multivorans]|uniref:GntR family transcriptional regulator n=1 Tax=Burkholderia multivorans TaxID=87883 RepID=UPI001C246BE4|nr:GntR family transcriptional regulator [Burkholderia multivorans]MBU9284173.1 GntR family transcriptional regulator [Burkholderia multivorans]